MSTKESKNKTASPLMRQYYDIKSQYPGALVLFRVGDFYETFGEDAIKASKILGIVLTKRNNGTQQDTELAGFPYHSLDNYLPKLVKAGYRVAICEQLEDPKKTKTIVKRGVTDLLSPGLVHHDKVIEARKANYIASLFNENKIYGISFLDISTGEFLVYEGSKEKVKQLVDLYGPSEIIISKNQKNMLDDLQLQDHYVFHLDDWIYKIDYTYNKILQQFKTETLKGFGIDEIKIGIISAGAILQYLTDNHQQHLQHINKVSRIAFDDFLWLDKYTIRNLEIVDSIHENGISLLKVLDDCATPMGSRLLRKWLLFPLKNKEAIDERLNIVAYLLQEKNLSQELLRILAGIGDLERLISKIAVRKCNPRDLNYLKHALRSGVLLKEKLKNCGSENLVQVADQIQPCEALSTFLEKNISEDAPPVVGKPGIILSGVHEELDRLRSISTGGKNYLLEMQKRESERTGITSLKIAFNNVFGYYIEVTHTHKDKVPPEWHRKQTLTNAERYITEELKKYEDEILGAEEKILHIEQELFENTITKCQEYIQLIQQNSANISKIDVLLNFAHLAIKNKYSKPEINDEKDLEFSQLRHAVIEKQLSMESPYVPNDVHLDKEKQQIIILTGPNMSGKSALLRQVALAVIMAQSGCFIPAAGANIGLIDKIFTRVGASDNISAGESTFMVEMIETANILNNLSDRSLVLLDEIGRGTSTYDGVSLAWSIAETLYLSPHKPLTVFATHYHELNELEKSFDRIHNFHISIKETSDKILFLRVLTRGGIESSFGLHVAKMAGIPQQVIDRAEEILSQLDKSKTLENNKLKINKAKISNFQISMFEADHPEYLALKEILSKVDINSLSPVEALLKLKEIKEIPNL